MTGSGDGWPSRCWGAVGTAMKLHTVATGWVGPIRDRPFHGPAEPEKNLELV